MKTLDRLIARLRSRTAREEGFTLVEVMVAVAILFIALLALARTATVAFTDIAASRQRQTANQLANQLVEEVRAIPYESVKRGLKTNQLTGDPNVINCSGTYYFPNLGCPAPTGSEKVVHTNGGPNTRPLVPHNGSVGPPDYPSTYNWSVYVTEAADAPSAGAYRVTAQVTWTPAQRSGVRSSIDAKTLLYSPTGSVDSSTHPFTGPRQAYFFGSANAGAGEFSSVGTAGGQAFDLMSADLLQTTSTVQTEQTIRAEGATYLPGLTHTVAGVESTSGGTSATSQADTDPVTTTGTYDRKQLGPQPFGFQFVGSTSASLLSWVDGADLGETTSATAAGGSSACNNQTDGFACGFGSATQDDGGNESDYGDFDTSMFAVVQDAGPAEVLRVMSTSDPTTAYARRTGAGPAGLVRGNVSWRLPEIWLGGLPLEMDDPNNWSGYWIRLTGFQATASAEAGPGAATPAVSVGGQLQYWRNNGYTTATVTTNGGSFDIRDISHRDNSVGPNNDRIDVLISGSLNIERSTTTRAVNAGATTEATAAVGSPLVAEFTYQILKNDVLVVDLTIAFNAGRARVATSYRPTA
jgi:type II secretory pathway pseudopilin PulG